MLSNTLVAMIAFSSSSALASQHSFDIQMDLAMAGKYISSPKITVKEGERGTVIQEDNGQKRFIEVVANSAEAANNKKAIHMAFVVGNLAKDGSRATVSQAQIVAKPGKEAQITVGWAFAALAPPLGLRGPPPWACAEELI